jgi:hypothetical protein
MNEGQHRTEGVGIRFVYHLQDCAQCRDTGQRIMRVFAEKPSFDSLSEADVAGIRELHEGLCDAGKNLFALGQAAMGRPS